MAQKNIQSVVRALTIIEKIAERNGVGVTELAREMDLSKSTVFGLLKTIEAMGYIFNSEKGGEYHLTYKIKSLANEGIKNDAIIEFAKPYLEEIAKKYEETLHFVIATENEVFYLEKIESTKSIRVYSGVGSSMPLHCTGVGKSILATRDNSEIYKYSKENGLKQYTEHTITDFDKLIEDINLTRERGYAIDDRENQDELYCLGVSIRNKQGIGMFAISLSLPYFRRTEYNEEEIVKDLYTAKEEIEKFFF